MYKSTLKCTFSVSSDTDSLSANKQGIFMYYICFLKGGGEVVVGGRNRGQDLMNMGNWKIEHL